MVSLKGQKLIVKTCRAIFDLYKIIINLYVRYWLSLFKSHAVPATEDELLLMPATHLARQIRQQKISSEDVIQAYVSRVKEVNPYINAVVEERFESALSEARQVDHYIRTSGKTEEELSEEQPLLGVPVTIKANVSCKGMTYDLGVPTRKGIKAEQDAEVKELLGKSGAIQLLLSNTPELCASWNTFNRVYGQTRNPYNLGRSPGGSSGGEGALVGSAASILGVGNDMAGSLRIPACLNGIFAHKPSSGIISSKGIFPYSENAIKLITNGPMCRYAGDLRLGLRCMAGSNSSKLDLGEKVDMKSLNIYFCDFDIGSPVVCPLSSEVKATVTKVVEYFRTEHNAEPQRLNLPKLKHGVGVFSVSSSNCMGRTLASMLANDPNKEIDLAAEMIKGLFGCSKFTSSGLFFAFSEKLTPKKGSGWYEIYRKIEDSLRRDINEILDRENTIFIFPSFPEEAPFPIEGISKLHIIAYYCLFNVFGLPATQVPVGFSRNGLPLGVQIVGGHLKDNLTITVAEQLEKAFGGWKCPGAS